MLVAQGPAGDVGAGGALVRRHQRAGLAGRHADAGEVRIDPVVARRRAGIGVAQVAVGAVQLDPLEVVRTGHLQVAGRLLVRQLRIRIEPLVGQRRRHRAAVVAQARGQHAIVRVGGEGLAVVRFEAVAQPGLPAAQARGGIEHRVVDAAAGAEVAVVVAQAGVVGRLAPAGAERRADAGPLEAVDPLAPQPHFAEAAGQADVGPAAEHAALRLGAVVGIEAALQAEHRLVAIAQVLGAAQAPARARLVAAFLAQAGRAVLAFVGGAQVDQAIQRHAAGFGGLDRTQASQRQGGAQDSAVADDSFHGVIPSIGMALDKRSPCRRRAGGKG
ncbi:Uncharacterised protein [Achromobacter xylosoxidans]|nr:Uncharacterised protein [Achromobacter xylosoxidans]CUJ50614.1 Uncharacterised protein [Achromobacter xylosoxidans]